MAWGLHLASLHSLGLLQCHVRVTRCPVCLGTDLQEGGVNLASLGQLLHLGISLLNAADLQQQQQPSQPD